MLGATIRIGRGSDAPNIGVHLIATSDGRSYVYASKPS